MRKGVVGVRRGGGRQGEGCVGEGGGDVRFGSVLVWAVGTGDALGKRLKHFDEAWPRGAFLGSSGSIRRATRAVRTC